MYTLLTTIFDDMSRTPQKFGEEKNVAYHAISFLSSYNQKSRELEQQ